MPLVALNDSTDWVTHPSYPLKHPPPPTLHTHPHKYPPTLKVDDQTFEVNKSYAVDIDALTSPQHTHTLKVDDQTFEVNETYAVDIALSTGDGNHII